MKRIIRNILLSIFGVPHTDWYIINVDGSPWVRYIPGWIYNGKFYPKE